MRCFGIFDKSTGLPLRGFFTDGEEYVGAMLQVQAGEALVELPSFDGFETLVLQDVNTERTDTEDSNG